MNEERAKAIKLANHILGKADQFGAIDPDGDLALLSRELLRSIEREKQMRYSVRQDYGQWKVIDILNEVNGPNGDQSVIWVTAVDNLVPDAKGLAQIICDILNRGPQTKG
jgi:hypothetical protein